MTDAKRGRPALPEAEKRQQIGVRTSPSLKIELERAAAENGRSVAQEAELRLMRSFEQERISGSADTDRLLASLAAEIALVERQTGKRWWRDLTTWAAVTEVLRAGPIQRMKPDQPYDDDVVLKAWGAVWSIQKAKVPLLERVRAAGVVARDLPAQTKGEGQYAALLELGLNDRAPEIGQVSQIVPEGSERDDLIATLTTLAALDRDEREALIVYREAMAPYREAEQRGVEAYRELDRERRARDQALIQPVD